jgi:hypothetical protein
LGRQRAAVEKRGGDGGERGSLRRRLRWRREAEAEAEAEVESDGSLGMGLDGGHHVELNGNDYDEDDFES